MKKFLFLLCAFLLLGLVYPTVIINSQDHRDVFTALSYAHSTGDDFILFYETYTGDYVLSKINTNTEEIIYIESEKEPMYLGDFYEKLFKTKYEVTKYISVNPLEFNLFMAEKTGIKKFIIVDSKYSGNLLSVLPYAKETNSFILYGDKENKENLISFLKKNPPSSLLVFGYVDEDVKDSIKAEGFSFSELGTGDKYEDNLVIAEELCSAQECNTFIITDYVSLEDTCGEADVLVILTGYTVPEITKEFFINQLNSGDYERSILVIPQYWQAVYDMKKAIEAEEGKEMRVIVKFGKVQAVEGSEIIPSEVYKLPGYEVSVVILDINYNPETGEYELVIKNTGETVAFVKFLSTLDLNGKFFKTFAQDDFLILKPGESKSFTTNIGGLDEGSLYQETDVFYSSSVHTVEKVVSSEGIVSSIAFVDLTELEVYDALYLPDKNKLSFTASNPTNQTLYFYYSIKYSDSEGKIFTIDFPAVIQLDPYENNVIQVDELLPEGKVPSEMSIDATYGGREGFLDKEGIYPVQIGGADYLWLILLVLLVAVLLLIWFFWKRRKKKKKTK
ncbi:hypothetical protein JXB01_03855 [Candidatus Micrarchaeota archaeon]|nr:hypothetical protein [Candidatus Micrarchaeota archaeon]